MKKDVNSELKHLDKLQISLQLDGPDAVRFRAYKNEQFIKRDAEAARKLMLERLAQLPTTQPATA